VAVRGMPTADKPDRMEDEEADDDEESGSSNDGSASGSDACDDEDDEELILLLQARLQTCGGRDYDAHVQLIKCLKDQGELKKLEKARQNFSKTFPLTEHMWLEWISDETRLAVTDAEHANITNLYERGIADYNTPKLWEHYMVRCLSALAYMSRSTVHILCKCGQMSYTFHQLHVCWLWCILLTLLSRQGHSQKRYKEREENDPMKPKLLNEARAVADRAIKEAGSHFTEGQRLWELQRAFECEILEVSPRACLSAGI